MEKPVYISLILFFSISIASFGNKLDAAHSFLIPQQPSNLYLVSQGVNSATINWIDNSIDETSFVVERSDVYSGEFSIVETISANINSYEDITILQNTVYYYRVKAINIDGDSDYSNTISIHSITEEPTNISFIKKIRAEELPVNSYFGNAISISDSIFIVSAPQDSVGAPLSGSVFIYKLTTKKRWELIKKITEPSPEFNHRFGMSVSISNNFAVVGRGSMELGIGSGAAYIYEKNEGGSNNWGLVKKLLASDDTAGNGFGLSVSISENTVAVSASTSTGNSGAVYIFSKDLGGLNNWGELKKVSASNLESGDSFGISISLSGAELIVGSYRDNDNGTNSGSAYIFSRNYGGTNNWGEVQKITASDGIAEDWFGRSVAVSGDKIIIGTRTSNGAGQYAGSAYIFSKDPFGVNTWSETKKLVASDSEAGDNYGFSVSISGNKAVVGASFKKNTFTASGAVYLYSKDLGGENNWGESNILTEPDGISVSLGTSVSISGNSIAAGGSGNQGGAYIYAEYINAVPSFTKGSDIITMENTTAQLFQGWSTDMYDGNDDSQTLTFNVVSDNPNLFSIQPVVDAITGDLSFTPAAAMSGTTTVTISLSDDGGTENGGVDTSQEQTFTITITPVNHAPSFTKGADITTLENSDDQFITLWATNIDDGDGGTQTLTFNVVSDNPNLFSIQPVVDAITGDLSFTPAAAMSGTTTVTISLSDDGGTENGGVDTSQEQTFTITITPVNHAPSFTKGADITTLENSDDQFITLWATNIDDGDGGTQTLTFNVVSDNPNLFSIQPVVDAITGDLSFTPAAAMSGTTTVTISLSDDGGTENGGVDTSQEQTFTITITPVNHAPSFTKGADITTLENSDDQFITLWATNIDDGDGGTQTLTFNVVSDNPNLFSIQPVVDAITGDLSFTPAAAMSGTTTVTISLSDDGGTENGGVDTSQEQTFIITITYVLGIENTVNGIQIDIYPNPSSDNLKIVFSELLYDIKVNIYNINGLLIEQIEKVNSKEPIELDLRNYNKGEYLIEIISNNNRAIHRFVKR